MQIIARNDEHRLVHMRVGIIRQPVWTIQRRTGPLSWGTAERYRVRWQAEKAAKEIGLDLPDDIKGAGDDE